MWLYFILLVTCVPVIRGQRLHSASDEPFFIQEPDNVTVISGKSVVLKCVVGNSQNRKVQWTYDDFGLGVDRKLSDWDHLQMIGANPQSKCSSLLFYVCINSIGISRAGSIFSMLVITLVVFGRVARIACGINCFLCKNDPHLSITFLLGSFREKIYKWTPHIAILLRGFKSVHSFSLL